MTEYTKDDLREAFQVSWGACLYRGKLHVDMGHMDEKISNHLFERWHAQNFE